MAKIGHLSNTPNASSVIVARQFVSAEAAVGVVTFNSGYTVGYLDVFLNGIKLQDAVDFSASDGRTVNLTTSAVAGDVIEMVSPQGTSILRTSPIHISSGGTTIKADSVTTLNFVGAGNTFKVNGNTVDVSIEGGGAIGVSSNSFASLVGAGFTHFNFIGAGITALGTGDVGGAKTAVVTINKTLTIGKRSGSSATINVSSGVSTIALRSGGIGTITF